MPKIRVLNPRKHRKSRKRKAGGKRKKNAHRRRPRVRRRHNARRRTYRRKAVKRSNRRRNPGAGELLIFGNPRHMAKRRRKHNRKRRKNPSRRFYAKANRHRRYRRRNPAISGDLVKTAVWAGAGAIGTRAGTQAILQSKNEGLMGYIGNGVLAFGLGWIGERFISAQAGNGLFLGGIIGLILRVAKEKVFASSAFAEQLSLQGMGDADFALSGYVNDPFTLPTTSEGADQLTVTPNQYWARPVVVSPARGLNGYDVAAMGGRGGPVVDRWKSPWG